MKQREKIFYASTGHYITKGLFLELCYVDPTYAIFTLKDNDHVLNDYLYKSLYRIYMAYDDPTEYQFATENFAGWEHWEKITEAPWFAEHIDRWRKEMELKLRSKALKEIMMEAENGGKSAYDANKFLANAGWKPKEPGGAPNKRGRPSKDQIRKEAQIQAETHNQIKNDLERLGIN